MWGGNVSAELDKTFREEFPQLMQDLCYSTIDYSLDRPFEEVQEEYHQTVNCIFDDALYQGSKKVADTIQKELSGKKTQLQKPPQNNECRSLASQVRQQQEARGLRTQCVPSKNSPQSSSEFQTVKDAYSSCRVGETVLVEWCGYQKYLWGKIRDDASFSQEFGDQISTPREWNVLFAQQKNIYEHEMEKARRGLLDTILFYQKYEQAYRTHAWLRAIYTKLQENKELLQDLRSVFDLYPEKFINAASP